MKRRHILLSVFACTLCLLAFTCCQYFTTPPYDPDCRDGNYADAQVTTRRLADADGEPFYETTVTVTPTYNRRLPILQCYVGFAVKEDGRCVMHQALEMTDPGLEEYVFTFQYDLPETEPTDERLTWHCYVDCTYSDGYRGVCGESWNSDGEGLDEGIPNANTNTKR